MASSRNDDVAATLVTTLAPGEGGGVTASQAGPIDSRTTVLPTIDSRGASGSLRYDARARYERKRVLGAGGMGEVSLVEDHDIGRTVAVKHLHVAVTNENGIARFAEEVRTIGALEHPNIVPIHDVGRGSDGRYYFVMKHVDGETLEAIIESLRSGDPSVHARYSIERRIEIFLGILHALKFAHARGIVHRDIKPANVMVGQFGEVVLMDWGVAKSRTRSEERTDVAGDAEPPEQKRLFATQSGSLVGTPAYMSPEQAQGDNHLIDERSDIYSACVVFAELVTLRHYLADRKTVLDMLDGVANAEFTRHSVKLHPQQRAMPPELVHFLIKGLKKRPEERFQTVGEMIDQLAALDEGKVPVQCPFTLGKRMTRELGRSMDRSGALTMLALLAAGALIVFAIITLIRSAL